MDKKQQGNKQVNELVAAMNAFVAAFWHEQMEDARRKKGGQDNGQE